MKRRAKLSEVEEIVSKFKASGLSVVKYCEKTNFEIGKLRWYIRRLKKTEKSKMKPVFTKIPLDIESKKESSVITVHCNGYRIEIPEKANKYFIDRVISNIGKSYV